MTRAAVLGSPIGHSRSPVMHRAAYAELGLSDWTYEAIDCTAEQLPELVRGLGPDWAGLSVTMPGKAAAAAVAQHRSDRVRLLGVANTLYRRPGADGWSAENTDVDGIVTALTVAGFRSGPSLVLGGGGTAMAAVLALAELGVAELTMAGRAARSTEAARALAGHLGIRVRHLDLDDPALGEPAYVLALSTLPAGVADRLAGALAAVPTLFDAIYHPWPTALAAAGTPGRVTVTGLDMLLHQAVAQVHLMTGLPAPAARMREALLAATGAQLELPLP